jgi:secondary thiamine-phosphate synthase enzyme
MATAFCLTEHTPAQMRASSDLVHLRTERPLQFIDITELVAERVRRSGVEHGLVCVQTLHTTTGLVVNEGEPLLTEDLEHALERLAPRDLRYAHDDVARRLNAAIDESANGHAHCKALALAPSVTLNVVEHRLVLGRWQCILLAELDGGRRRSLSILVLGVPAAGQSALEQEPL